MSAFICSDLHISVIAHSLTDTLKERIGLAKLLRQVNVNSVNHRYNTTVRSLKVKMPNVVPSYSFADLFKLVECWDYQACEGSLFEYKVASAYVFEQCRLRGIDNTDCESTVWSI
jgi:hypothetical protein